MNMNCVLIKETGDKGGCFVNFFHLPCQYKNVTQWIGLLSNTKICFNPISHLSVCVYVCVCMGVSLPVSTCPCVYGCMFVHVCMCMCMWKWMCVWVWCVCIDTLKGANIVASKYCLPLLLVTAMWNCQLVSCKIQQSILEAVSSTSTLFTWEYDTCLLGLNYSI